MKTRRKRIARPRRSTSKQRFRIKAPRLPNLDVSKSQQRELAGIGFLLLAGLLILAVALQTSGSAMHFLRAAASPQNPAAHHPCSRCIPRSARPERNE